MEFTIDLQFNRSSLYRVFFSSLKQFQSKFTVIKFQFHVQFLKHRIISYPVGVPVPSCLVCVSPCPKSKSQSAIHSCLLKTVNQPHKKSVEPRGRG